MEIALGADLRFGTPRQLMPDFGTAITCAGVSIRFGISTHCAVTVVCSEIGARRLFLIQPSILHGYCVVNAPTW